MALIEVPALKNVKQKMDKMDFLNVYNGCIVSMIFGQYFCDMLISFCNLVLLLFTTYVREVTSYKFIVLI